MSLDYIIFFCEQISVLGQMVVIRNYRNPLLVIMNTVMITEGKTFCNQMANMVKVCSKILPNM